MSTAFGNERAPSWLAQKERGSALLIRLITWITLRLGRHAGRLLLYPICAYFIAFSKRARRASAEFLQRVHRAPPTYRAIFRHYHTFASTIHDRVYLLAGRHQHFDLRLHRPLEVEALLSNPRGCILLGSHLGSFEALRVHAFRTHACPVNVLMHVDNARKINSVLHALAPDIESRIIPLGDPLALLRVQQCLERGEIVGILGDRVRAGERTHTCDFLGAPAPFPLGPFLLSAVLGAPVVLCFGLYRGGRRYDLHLEAFAERIVLDRKDREASVRPAVERYARRLEHYCRQAPDNWFNFYPYWPESDAQAKAPLRAPLR